MPTKGVPVSKYTVFFSYSSAAVKGMIDHPSDRSAAVRELAKSLGGSVEAVYWMQGNHDGFVIGEFPDSVSVSAVSAAVAATGAVSSVETHEIFDHDQQEAIVKAAKTALQAYTPPN
jgi:uncharacterized protein with GYD domain